jgi:hypothetical protein
VQADPMLEPVHFHLLLVLCHTSLGHQALQAATQPAFHLVLCH